MRGAKRGDQRGSNPGDRCTGITYPSTATNSFVYNGEDLRVSKTDSSGTSSPITDGTEPASPVLKDARAVYTPGLSERTTSSPASKWYHADALGSTRGITNSSQTVTDSILYDAFGMTVSRTGSTATPFGFVGAQQYQSDPDSGLMLLGHRFYDPSIGRFISSDPAKAGTNWLAYCENEPLVRSDGTGENWIIAIKLWWIGLVSRVTRPISMPPPPQAIGNPPASYGRPQLPPGYKLPPAPVRPPAVPVDYSFPRANYPGLTQMEPILSESDTDYPRPPAGLTHLDDPPSGSGGGVSAPITILVASDALREGIRAVGPYRRTVGRMMKGVNDDPENFEIPQQVHW